MSCFANPYWELHYGWFYEVEWHKRGLKNKEQDISIQQVESQVTSKGILKPSLLFYELKFSNWNMN